MVRRHINTAKQESFLACLRIAMFYRKYLNLNKLCSGNLSVYFNLIRGIIMGIPCKIPLHGYMN